MKNVSSLLVWVIKTAPTKVMYPVIHISLPMKLQLYTEGSDADNARQSSEEKEKDDMKIEPYREDDPDHPNNLTFDDNNGVCAYPSLLTILSTPFSIGSSL